MIPTTHKTDFSSSYWAGHIMGLLANLFGFFWLLEYEFHWALLFNYGLWPL